MMSILNVYIYLFIYLFIYLSIHLLIDSLIYLFLMEYNEGKSLI